LPDAVAESILLSIDLHKLMGHFADSGEAMSIEAVENVAARDGIPADRRRVDCRGGFANGT